LLFLIQRYRRRIESATGGPWCQAGYGREIRALSTARSCSAATVIAVQPFVRPSRVSEEVTPQRELDLVKVRLKLADNGSTCSISGSAWE
jgi:hypothetical protein